MSIRDWLRRYRKWLVVGSLVIVSYLGSYAALSALGTYRASPSGKTRYSFGLAVTDREIWQPKRIRWDRFQNIKGESATRGNFQGYLFSPLIILDRAYWHSSGYYFDE